MHRMIPIPRLFGFLKNAFEFDYPWVGSFRQVGSVIGWRVDLPRDESTGAGRESSKSPHRDMSSLVWHQTSDESKRDGPAPFWIGVFLLGKCGDPVLEDVNGSLRIKKFSI